MAKCSDIAMLAGVVGAVGTADFPMRFLAVMRAFCGARLSSAFSYARQDPPRALFAEGDCAAVPDFARAASQAYARQYWRNDQVPRLTAGRQGGVTVIRTCAHDIADPGYRRTCYERGGIAERLSMLSAGTRGLMANGYRASCDGGFRPAEIARMEQYAPILMAALTRHVDLSTRRHDDGAPSETMRILCAAGLSLREAEVAAGLILGQTQEEIGTDTGLSLSSVITYRRRAYCKLGVMDKRELVAAYRRLPPAPLQRIGA